MAMTHGGAAAVLRCSQRAGPHRIAHKKFHGVVRCYSTSAPAQAQPSQQRNLYANFAIYKGKAAASFRVRLPDHLMSMHMNVEQLANEIGVLVGFPGVPCCPSAVDTMPDLINLLSTVNKWIKCMKAHVGRLRVE